MTTPDAIAAALGSTFVPRAPDSLDRGTILIDGATDIDHGPGLWIRCGSWGDAVRVVVSGVYPRTIVGESITPWFVLPLDERETHLQRITMSADKPPERIAREIERRFLPEYRRLYGLVAAYVADRNAGLRSQASARDRLAALVPGAAINPSWVGRSDRSRTIWIPGGRINLDPAGERVSRLELSNLSVDDAEWILRFLFERGG